MFCARESGWNPSAWIAARTFPRVAGRTESGVFTLRETVPTDTPDNRATSRIVAGFPRAFFKRPLPALDSDNRPFCRPSLIDSFTNGGEADEDIRLQGFQLDPPESPVHILGNVSN
jgi:hypothetical protein